MRRLCTAGTWLTILFILGTCDLVRAQASLIDDVSTFSFASSSSRLNALGCDLFQMPASATSLVQNNLKKQQAEYVLGRRLAADVDEHNELVMNDFILQYVIISSRKSLAVPSCPAVSSLK